MVLDQIEDDLEEAETPESMMLRTVSGQDHKDRTDREVVTPWLKFLWESYRTVLDVLKNNAKLEAMYQTAAQQAFQFCLKYKRKTGIIFLIYIIFYLVIYDFFLLGIVDAIIYHSSFLAS
jgi:translation initiation factor 3 subunit A